VTREEAHSLERRAALGSGAQVTASSNANTIRSLQWLLTARGHALTVDGVLGDKTKAAVVAFQKQIGATADGIAGPVTLGALVSTVQSGSTGNFAKAAQAALNAFGKGLVVDGAFGDASKAAAVSFQKSKGLTADGIIGPATWTALFGGSGGGGGTTTPTPGNCDSVTGPAPQSDTVVASGFRVHKCLASRLNDMVAAAKKSGITLTGWGWRDYNEQIALRRQHCGTTYYDIWQKPSSQCNPPTATPGKSLHEYGLAVDFSSMTSTSAGFKWLKANAAKYHFYNLPSEAWHWSWNGH